MSSGKKRSSSSLSIALESDPRSSGAIRSVPRILFCLFLGLIAPRTDLSSCIFDEAPPIVLVSALPVFCRLLLPRPSALFFAFPFADFTSPDWADATDVARDVLLDLCDRISSVSSRRLRVRCALSGNPPGLSPFPTPPEAYTSTLLRLRPLDRVVTTLSLSSLFSGFRPTLTFASFFWRYSRCTPELDCLLGCRGLNLL